VHGIVNVFAKDNATTKDRPTAIALPSGLNKDVEKMASAAEEYVCRGSLESHQIGPPVAGVVMH